MNVFRTSLRNKLIGVFLVPTLLIVLVYGFLAYFAARQGLEDELGKRLVAVGQTLSADMSESIEAAQIARLEPSKKRVLERLRDKLRQTREQTEVRRVFLFDRDMKSLVDTRQGVSFGQQLYEVEADRVEVGRTFDTGKPTTSVLFRDEQGTFYKTGYAPITQDGQVIAAIGVEGSAQYFELLRNFASMLTVLGGVGLLLVVVAGTLFSRALVKPVNRLVDAARRLGEGDFEAPVADGGDDTSPGEAAEEGDEIAFLASSFEEMRKNILSRDRQMQMMLSGIAHEVRNPLGGMELFCGLLREDLEEEPDTEETRQKLDKLDKIRRELTYLEKVVKDFLDFARNVPLELERFPAGEFADEVCGLLAGEVDEAGCALSVEVDDELELSADRERLRRAVINLIRNAYQACDGSGTITLAVSARGDDTREIAVRDDGPGIPAEKVEEILTPFFTTKEKGSGLGLALTKQIVSQHGGRMEIDSEVGVGTVVRIVIPFDPDVKPVEQQIPEGWLG
ncbi:HAMP domain-containing histidine kinase [Persicimonas caeni]|uniref:histidine kinase n=1 Tax=Persicimonas caeni TaxID=2292766 RepID=A0A4Y6PRL4_PERCE|nr:HAMP domain-containing sensor histidine kinase [Persicimonas caeni]QDG50657.1 HAMP domain-containing histidine kinase [Persicimonas caeni]QED31878.1 HAMP domain-containing histidine kinase [Persicimonas caeni]